MEIQKYHLRTDGRTYGLTWVGARDTCVSKNHQWFERFFFSSQDYHMVEINAFPKLEIFFSFSIFPLCWSENNDYTLLVKSWWKIFHISFPYLAILVIRIPILSAVHPHRRLLAVAGARALHLHPVEENLIIREGCSFTTVSIVNVKFHNSISRGHTEGGGFWGLYSKSRLKAFLTDFGWLL